MKKSNLSVFLLAFICIHAHSQENTSIAEELDCRQLSDLRNPDGSCRMPTIEECEEGIFNVDLKGKPISGCIRIKVKNNDENK